MPPKRSTCRRLCFTTLASAFAFLLQACNDLNNDQYLSYRIQVNEGIKALRTFDFKQAYASLAPVQSELPPGTELWTKATYTLALAAWHKTPTTESAIREAETLLQSLIKAQPETQLAANALLDLGRIAEIADYRNDSPDLALAREYYERVRRDYPGTEAAIRATLYLAQSLAQTFETDDLKQAVELLREILKASPDSEWTGVVGQYTAYLLAFYLGDKDAAIEPYLMAVEAGLPRPAVADISLWQLGNLAEDAGRPMVAVEAFTRIVDDFPRSVYGTVARNRIQAIAEQNPDAQIRIPELSDIELGR